MIEERQETGTEKETSRLDLTRFWRIEKEKMIPKTNTLFLIEVSPRKNVCGDTSIFIRKGFGDCKRKNNGGPSPI
jgi:hypothetical protein